MLFFNGFFPMFFITNSYSKSVNLDEESGKLHTMQRLISDHGRLIFFDILRGVIDLIRNSQLLIINSRD